MSTFYLIEQSLYILLMDFNVKYSRQVLPAMYSVQLITPEHLLSIFFTKVQNFMFKQKEMFTKLHNFIQHRPKNINHIFTLLRVCFTLTVCTASQWLSFNKKKVQTSAGMSAEFK